MGDFGAGVAQGAGQTLPRVLEQHLAAKLRLRDLKFNRDMQEQRFEFQAEEGKKDRALTRANTDATLALRRELVNRRLDLTDKELGIKERDLKRRAEDRATKNFVSLLGVANQQRRLNESKRQFDLGQKNQFLLQARRNSHELTQALAQNTLTNDRVRLQAHLSNEAAKQLFQQKALTSFVQTLELQTNTPGSYYFRRRDRANKSLAAFAQSSALEMSLGRMATKLGDGLAPLLAVKDELREKKASETQAVEADETLTNAEKADRLLEIESNYQRDLRKAMEETARVSGLEEDVVQEGLSFEDAPPEGFVGPISPEQRAAMRGLTPFGQSIADSIFPDSTSDVLESLAGDREIVAPDDIVQGSRLLGVPEEALEQVGAIVDQALRVNPQSGQLEIIGDFSSVDDVGEEIARVLNGSVSEQFGVRQTGFYVWLPRAKSIAAVPDSHQIANALVTLYDSKKHQKAFADIIQGGMEEDLIASIERFKQDIAQPGNHEKVQDLLDKARRRSPDIGNVLPKKRFFGPGDPPTRDKLANVLAVAFLNKHIKTFRRAIPGSRTEFDRVFNMLFAPGK